MIYVHVYGCLERPERGIRFSETRVTGGCELPHLDACNQVQSYARAANALNYCTISSVPKTFNTLQFCMYMMQMKIGPE